MIIRSVIQGAGSYLPEKVLTNADLAKKVDTTDEWIVERSGIRERHIAADTEKTEGTLTEDDCDSTKEEVQELTKTYEAKVAELARAKEAEVMDG